MKKILTGITNSSSLLINLPTNINLITYKKNTKVVKFILLSELIYIIVSQSRNYKRLYNNLIYKINLIKKKLYNSIKDYIEMKNTKDISVLKEKLNKTGILYDDFILMTFLNYKEFYVKKKIRKELSPEIKKIKKNLLNNNLYHKYLYLKKIVVFINKLIYSKLETLNFFFYRIIFKLLKKESHRLKLKILMSKLIRTYLFNGINLNLSRQILQKYLLKCFEQSKLFYIKYVPNSEEIHVKDKNSLIKNRDTVSSVKDVLNGLIKRNYGFSYYRLLRKLKHNNLENVSIFSLFKVLNNIELNSMFGILKTRGLYMEFNNNHTLLDINSNHINEFQIFKPFSLLKSNVDFHLFKNKNFLNIYSLYNFINCFFKRNTNDAFLDTNEKIVNLFINSYTKYIYFPYLMENLDEKDVSTYKTLKYIHNHLIESNSKILIKSQIKNQTLKSYLNVFLGDTISIYDLKKKMSAMEEVFVRNLLSIFNSYFYNINNLYRVNTVETNVDYKDINTIFNNFDFSNLLNQLNLNYNLNSIVYKYLKKLQNIIKNNYKKCKLNSIIVLDKNNNAFSNYKKNIISNIEMLKKESSIIINNNIDVEKSKLDISLNKYESFLLNKSLLFKLYDLDIYKNNYILNTEIIKDIYTNINIMDAYKLLLVKKFNGNIQFKTSRTYSSIKTYLLQENINDFFYKKLVIFSNLIKLTKKDFSFIVKNNIFFSMKNKIEYLDENNKLNLDQLAKVHNNFMLDDFYKIISHTIDYTTNELEKITKHQMKKRKFNRLY